MATKIQPNKITKKFLSVLPERSCDILMRRFGLENNAQKSTLESIGKGYGITRERVRQIESNALRNIRKSDVFENETAIFNNLSSLIESLGGIVSEEDLLGYISNKPTVQNHIHFLLVVGDPFFKEKENKYFKTRWFTDHDLASKVHNSLLAVRDGLSIDDLHPENDMVNLFLKKIDGIDSKYKKNDVVKRWFGISKEIDSNPFSEWGLAESNNINAKGIRDYAYLSIRQHGSPLHFREVAKTISDNFGKNAHVATCHNELIKDPRFVLVGRGLYALKDWGYAGGVVRDVIKNILEQSGPLTREEIIKKVLKERYVKENTVIVNLQDPKHFKRDSKDRYIFV